MAWDRKVPFDDKGSLLSYPETWRGLNWRDNYEVEMTLTFQYFSRGRSAARAVFENDEGQSFEMFLTDFGDLVKAGKLKKDKVTATWTFCKRGQNFGICLPS